MKRFLLLVSIFVFSILLVACENNGPGQGEGEIEQEERLECDYDENGGFTFTNFEKGTLILQINGQEIQISEPNYNVSSLNLEDGFYTINMYYYVDGELISSDKYYYQKGEQKGDSYLVTFFDDRNDVIKEVFLPNGSLLEESLFPKYTNKVGVTYSWDYDFELGSPIENNVEVHLLSTYTKYTITYNLNGGSFKEEVDNYYTINSYGFSYPIPSKEGCVFDGWYEDSDFSGKQVTSVDLLNPKNVVLYAHWIELTQDTKDVISVIEDMLKSPQMTISTTSEGKKYEFAYDNSSSFYCHSLSNSKPDYVISNSYYYSYSDKTFYKQNVRPDQYMDILSLKSLSGQIISTNVKTSGTTTTYTSNVKDNSIQLVIVVKEGKVSQVSMTNGKENVTYNITYTCKKISVDASKFTEKIFVTIYLIEIRNGIVPEIPIEHGKFDVQKGVKIKECDFIGKDGSINESFGGIYLDEERTQEINLDYIVNESVDLYCVNYGNIDESLEHYKFTLNVHCDCSECDDVETYKDITYADLNKVKHFEGSGKEEKILDIVEEGKHIRGWFTSSKEGAEQVLISQLVSDHLYEKKYYEDLVIDSYRQTKNVETVKGKLMCDCDNHEDLGDYEKYIIKGSWYWAWDDDEHIKNGYMCESLSLNKDLSSLEEGFQIDENTTIYFNWVPDTRVNVTVEAYDDKNGDCTIQFYDKAEELYERIALEFSGLYDGKIASGFYLDKNFTKPFTEETKLKDGDVIYIKWTEAKQVTFYTINGYKEQFFVPLDFDLSSIDWSKYKGQIPNEESSLLEDRLFKFVYYASQSSYEYVTLFEFYKDEGRTQKITSLNNVEDVYLGYKSHPMVNIICDESCDMDHTNFIYSFDNQLNSHIVKDGEDYYVINFYLDSEYTIKLQSSNYQYFFEDFTAYGKKEYAQIDLNIDCNCLIHTSNIVGKYNSLVDALKDCDYGMGKGQILPSLYSDKEGITQMCYGEEFLYDKVPNLYVITSGKVKVYCSCKIEGHDGTGFDLVLVKEKGYLRTLEMLEREHRKMYKGVPYQYNVYSDKEKTNLIYSDDQLNDGDSIYIDLIVDENYIPVSIVYGNEYTETIYAYKNDYFSLPRFYNNYNVVGYYKDAAYSIPLETVDKGDSQYIIPEEALTIYCKLELAKYVTFTYTNDLGEEKVITKYLIGDNYASEFYSYLVPNYGYMSYVVDSSNNRVDPNDPLKENEVYKEKSVKLENCIVITIECDCDYCTQEKSNKYMVLENGDIINVVKNNTLLVKKGESAIPYLRDCFSEHYSDINISNIRDMKISLTKDGEALNTEGFDYYGDMLDDAPYKFAYNEDTTLYLSFM